MPRFATCAPIAALAAAALLAAPAGAQTVTVTGLDDFTISQVGEGFFGPPTRLNVLNSRFQINGRNPVSAQRNYGQWTAFTIPTAGLGPVPTLESVRVDIFGANPTTGQTVQPVIRGGTIQVYYTTDTRDVVDAANGFTWVTTDPAGLGNQFTDLTLVGSAAVVTGDQSAFFDLDLSAVRDSMIARINAGEAVRLILTTPDQDMASNWGVGVPGTSTILAFNGPAPTVTFVIPAPGAAGLLALGGLVAARRRR